MKLRYEVVGGEFSTAGTASSSLKKTLRKLGVDSEIIRRTAICMYEAEINMVIHADGGFIDVDIMPDYIYIRLADKGPGIADLEQAMKEGYSTASEEAREIGFGAGMGLPNMKRFSDKLEITSVPNGGTTVEITVKLVPEKE